MCDSEKDVAFRGGADNKKPAEKAGIRDTVRVAL